MKKTIIVMPVANEGATMQHVIDEIMALPYDNLYLYPVIDSFSTDNTEQIIREAEILYNHRVKCLYYKKSTGMISCYLYGFHVALKDGAQQIIEMDGGGSHDPKELPLFIDALEEGYDCVWSSRFMQGGEEKQVLWYRKLLSKGGTWIANLFLGTRLSDMTSGYEAFQADVLSDFYLSRFLSKGHMYQTEMRYYCRKYSYKEVPIHYTGGKSSLKFKSVIDAVSVLFRLRKNEKRVRR